MTLKEVSEDLRVSTRTVVDMIERGDLSALVIGSGFATRYRIPREDVERFKEAHTVRAAPPKARGKKKDPPG